MEFVEFGDRGRSTSNEKRREQRKKNGRQRQRQIKEADERGSTLDEVR